jgi:Reverse transcriptase (RNA-dependent DNA polymerase)
MDCGSYRGIKLLDQAMKVMERVMEKWIRDRVKIDKMQFGFSKGKCTTDAIFIVHQLQEKYLGVKRELWLAFVDIEKAFDGVPREVLWWALRELG